MKKQQELVDLILNNAKMEEKKFSEEFDINLPRDFTIFKPLCPVQLWYSPALGFQFSDWNTVGLGPVSQAPDHSPLLHVSWIGEVEEEVGTVIMANSRFGLYGMVRGGGKVDVEIRPYHEDFVKRIYRVDILIPNEEGPPYDRKTFPFGFKTISP